MKKTVILIVALVVIVTAFAACTPANSVNGLWYDKAGLLGTMEFKSGGVVTMTMMGVPLDGTYTFDAAKGEGTITIAGQEGTFTLADGLINMDSQVYTTDKVEQQNLDLGNLLGN